MGELCTIGSMKISMRFRDTQQHHKPHVHAHCDGCDASVGVDGELLAGSLPAKQMKISNKHWKSRVVFVI